VVPPEQTWRTRAGLTLADDEIHVWRRRSTNRLLASRSLADLSSGERQRPAGSTLIRTGVDSSSGAGRSGASWASTGSRAEPGAVQYGPRGKPELAAGLDDSSLTFNLAHAGHLLVRVHQERAIGIDVEQMRPCRMRTSWLPGSSPSPRTRSIGPCRMRRRFRPSTCAGRGRRLLKAAGEGDRVLE